MADYKLPLSASTGGRQIAVTSTSSAAGTTIHTTTGTLAQFDEIWLYAHNINSSDNVDLTIQWGGTDDADEMPTTIAAGVGMIQIVPGLILTNGLVVKAYASSADQINISGFVCRTFGQSTL